MTNRTPTSRDGDDALKEAVLKAALKDAAFDGFTDNVLAKAGKEAGADQAALARLFPEGPMSLIEYFSTSIDEAMEKQLAATDLGTRKIRAAHQDRGDDKALAPGAAQGSGAARRRHAHACRCTRRWAPSCCTARWTRCGGSAGDTSTDFNFYTKRAILAGVYGSVLVRWFSDTSDDDSATEAFLDARIENVMQFEKFKAKAKQALSNFPAFAAWTKSPSK